MGRCSQFEDLTPAMLAFDQPHAHTQFQQEHSFTSHRGVRGYRGIRLKNCEDHGRSFHIRVRIGTVGSLPPLALKISASVQRKPQSDENHVLTVREALGGKWATSPIGWTILFAPSTLLVVLQESSTPFTFWPLVLVSSIAQHLVGGLVAILIALPYLRRRALIPIPVLFVVWAVIGAMRGVVAGAFAAATTGVDPDYAYRISSWVAISIIWLPLFTYSIAQFERRRALLGEWERASEHLRSEQTTAGTSAVELQKQLIQTVQHAIGPVLNEIRESLTVVSKGIGNVSLSSIRFRLALVARDAGRIVDTPSDVPEVASRLRLAPLTAAIDFDQSRPLYVSLLTTLALATLVLPDSIRTEGLAFGLEIATALLVSMGIMTLTLAAVRWWRNRARAHLIAVASLGFFLSGIAGSVVILLFDNWMPIVPREIALILTLPLGAIFAMGCVSGAVGLAVANADLAQRTAQTSAQSAALHKRSKARDERVRKQLTELMHGPIQGRLSACAMALNFHASSKNPADVRGIAKVTADVLKHLKLASRDLEALGKP
jgi:hypothetical protein